jgi:hypothetical protein
VAGKPVAVLSGAVVLLSLVIGFAGSLGIGLGAVLVLPDSTEQFLCDLLIVPSLQTNCAPSQCAIPPFLPEHGVFAALLANGNSRTAAKISVRVSVLFRNFIFGFDKRKKTRIVAGLSRVFILLCFNNLLHYLIKR